MPKMIRIQSVLSYVFCLNKGNYQSVNYSNIYVDNGPCIDELFLKNGDFL